MSERLTVRVRRGPQEPALAPPRRDAELDALGETLFGRLTAALSRGRPGPVALALFEDSVQQIDLGPAAARGPSVAHQLLAAGAGQPGCGALAQLAVLSAPAAGGGARPFATAFIELPDNRWWMRWAALDGAGGAIGAARTRSAVEGWPKPALLGGWFSLARRAGLRLQIDAPGAQPGLQLVH